MSTTDTPPYAEPAPRLIRKQLPTGDARVAVFARVYDAPVTEVWDACTNADRLSRWYVPVTGDLRLGGMFQQAGMGSGEIVRCEAPSLLVVSLGRGSDEIELRLFGNEEGTTRLELRHATTHDQHEIGGQMYDAIFCMGGGYYPRLWALGQHLRGTLSDEYDPTAFHRSPEMQPVIQRGSAAMEALLEADAKR